MSPEMWCPERTGIRAWERTTAAAKIFLHRALAARQSAFSRCKWMRAALLKWSISGMTDQQMVFGVGEDAGEVEHIRALEKEKGVTPDWDINSYMTVSCPACS